MTGLLPGALIGEAPLEPTDGRDLEAEFVDRHRVEVREAAWQVLATPPEALQELALSTDPLDAAYAFAEEAARLRHAARLLDAAAGRLALAAASVAAASGRSEPA